MIITLLSGQSTMEFVFHYFDAGIKEFLRGKPVSVKGESKIHITSSQSDKVFANAF